MADTTEQDTTVDGSADALTALIMGTAEEAEAPDDDEQDEGTEGERGADDEQEDGDDEDQDTDDDESDDEDSEDDTEEEGEDEDDDAPKVVPDDAVVFTLDDEGKSIPVTAGEAKAGYLRQSDYTRKTTEIATKTQAIQSEREELQKALAGVLKVMDGEDAESTPEKLLELAQTDPERAMQLRLEREARAEQRKRVEAASKELADRTAKEQQEAADARRQQEFAKLLDVMPDLKDPEKAKVRLANMTEAAKAVGFAAEDMNAVTDHRLMRLLDLAYTGLRLSKKGKPKPQPKGAKVATLRPGVRKPGAGNKVQVEREKRFAETRSVDDAAASLLGLAMATKKKK